MTEERLQELTIALIKAQLEYDQELPRIIKTLENSSIELREIFDCEKAVIAQVGGVLYSVEYNTKREYYFDVIKAIDVRKGAK